MKFKSIKLSNVSLSKTEKEAHKKMRKARKSGRGRCWIAA